MSEQMNQNLSNGQAWIRLLFMALFGLIYMVADVLLLVVVVIQFGFVIFTGERNQDLLSFSGQLSRYLYQILRFLTYNSEHKPFPFAEWPEGEEAEPLQSAEQAPAPKAADEAPAKPASSKKVTKKTGKKTAKKAATKKVTKKKASKKKTSKKTAGKDAGA